MLIVVCYDISEPRRLRRVARALEAHGERVLESVFECWMDAPGLGKLKVELAKLIDPRTDRIAYARLERGGERRVIVVGRGSPPRDWDFYIV